jgi:hypothetical protein
MSHHVPPARPSALVEHVTTLLDPRAGLVLARNAVPVVGVYAMGWSEGVCLLDYWWDGVTFLGALAGAVAPEVAREVGPSPFPATRGGRIAATAAVWTVGFGVLGLPFWFALLFLGSHPAVDGLAIVPAIAGDPWVWPGFLAVLAANAWEVRRSGIASWPEATRRRRLNWEFNLLVARVAVLLLLVFFFRRGIVAAAAVALSYVELFPFRTLRLLGAPVREDDVPA